MLDVSLVLQEAEALLDSHYTEWQERGSSRVRVYHTPQKQSVPVVVTKTERANHPTLPLAAQKANLPPAAPIRPTGLSDVVANLFVLLLLGVLNNKLAKGGARPAH